MYSIISRKDWRQMYITSCLFDVPYKNLTYTTRPICLHYCSVTSVTPLPTTESNNCTWTGFWRELFSRNHGTGNYNFLLLFTMLTSSLSHVTFFRSTRPIQHHCFYPLLCSTCYFVIYFHIMRYCFTTPLYVSYLFYPKTLFWYTFHVATHPMDHIISYSLGLRHICLLYSVTKI